MPQIIVTAGDSANREGKVLLRERITKADFESERFTVNLLERLGWAVDDAAAAEQHGPSAEEASGAMEPDELAEPETELVEA
jgi:hypothetical protein